jgi:hypothetical protein
MVKLQWSKEVFGTQLEIRRENDVVGTIRWENMFSSKANAIINGRVFVLKRKYFLSKLEIYDSGEQLMLGSIMINMVNTRSDLVLNGKRFELEVRNFWQSRWSWKFNDDEIITYTSNEFLTKDKGEIELCTTCSDEVDILILLGLFVRNQFVLFMLLLTLIGLIIIL